MRRGGSTSGQDTSRGRTYWRDSIRPLGVLLQEPVEEVGLRSLTETVAIATKIPREDIRERESAETSKLLACVDLYGDRRGNDSSHTRVPTNTS